MYPLVLTFHKIIPDQYVNHPYYWKSLCTPYSTFLCFIESLYQENFAFISLQELEYAKISPSERTVLLTFDDGYYNNIEYAYPLLKSENIPFVMAINGRCIENNTWQWFDKVWYYGIQQGKTEQERIQMIEKFKYDIFALEQWLNTQAIPQNYSEIEHIFFGIANVQELKKLQNVSFVSHTYSHYILTALPESILHNEITQNILFAQKNHINLHHNYFVLPNGTLKDFNLRTIEVLKKNQVKGIFTMLPYTKLDDLIPRYTPVQNTWQKERKRYLWRRFLYKWK
ncbi:MAG: polysaccharide deacetylase family protein [Bacteroidia bacterium]|nr:polysaccharide deacetylase family protein [Bacteroidia bacterium]MDW8302172.1 polysaccharide deacetylase family protein [Bacteroidia bacterium]